ncbi:HNH endonuclease [Nocardia sp. IFM 10818]
MTLTCCLECGEPSASRWCEQHKPVVHHTDSGTNHRGPDRRRWERLSAKLRKLQPWCTACGATTNLTVDHIQPLNLRPDLAFDLGNLQVLCRKCNSAKGIGEAVPQYISPTARGDSKPLGIQRLPPQGR